MSLDYPEEYADMISIDLDSMIDRFIFKSGDYPPEAFKFLGERAQLVELSKKFFKLKAAIWDGKALEGEDESEIAEDMIGHLMILLYLRRTKGLEA